MSVHPAVCQVLECASCHEMIRITDAWGFMLRSSQLTKRIIFTRYGDHLHADVHQDEDVILDSKIA